MRSQVTVLQANWVSTLASWISLSIPRGPRVVLTTSATAVQAFILLISCGVPWLVSVPSLSRTICGACKRASVTGSQARPWMRGTTINRHHSLRTPTFSILHTMKCDMTPDFDSCLSRLTSKPVGQRAVLLDNQITDTKQYELELSVVTFKLACKGACISANWCAMASRCPFWHAGHFTNSSGSSNLSL